jgi:hypothetical protein
VTSPARAGKWHRQEGTEDTQQGFPKHPPWAGFAVHCTLAFWRMSSSRQGERAEQGDQTGSLRIRSASARLSICLKCSAPSCKQRLDHVKTLSCGARAY